MVVSGTDELPTIQQAGLWIVVDPARNHRTALIVAEKRFLSQRRFEQEQHSVLRRTTEW